MIRALVVCFALAAVPAFAQSPNTAALGQVVGRYAFRGTPLYETSLFAEGRVRVAPGRSLKLRVEGFNAFNHANILGRIGTYGDGAAPSATFGTPNTGLANLDPARMVQFQVRFNF